MNWNWWKKMPDWQKYVWVLVVVVVGLALVGYWFQ